MWVTPVLAMLISQRNPAARGWLSTGHVGPGRAGAEWIRSRLGILLTLARPRLCLHMFGLGQWS